MEYLLADGDGVGDRIELLLLDDRVQEAADYSRAIAHAIETTTRSLNDLGAEIVYAGGDDLCARTASVFDVHLLERIRAEFFRVAGSTLSVGVGRLPSEAANNLRRAKLMGKNRIIGSRRG